MNYKTESKENNLIISDREHVADYDIPCFTTLLDFKLRRSQLLLSQQFTELLSRINIRATEFAVLAMIARYPGQKQTIIAEHLGIKRANFVFLMDSLEDRGVAERRKEGNDRRSHSLYLTSKGEKFVEEMITIWKEHDKKIVSKLKNRENLNQLTLLLDMLICPQEKTGEIAS